MYKEDTFNWDKVQEKALGLIKAKSNNSKYVIEHSIERIFEYIKNPNHPFSFFINRMTDDELAELICHIITDKERDRNLISNMSKKGMKNDLTSFRANAKSIDDNNLSQEMRKNKTQLERWYAKNAEKYNPENKVGDIFAMIKPYWYRNKYKDLICDMVILNDTVYYLLMEEKQKAQEYGFDSVYYKRVHQYINFSATMFAEIQL